MNGYEFRQANKFLGVYAQHFTSTPHGKFHIY